MEETFEDLLFFYICQLIVFLNKIHEGKIIYRNLKPENIVLDDKGNIKIIDFSKSKMLTYDGEKGLPDDLSELIDHVYVVLLVQSVAVSGLHDDIVRLPRHLRLFQERLALIPDIAGKDDLFLHIPLFQPDLDAGGAQKMADIREPEPDAVACREDLAVRIGHKELQCSDRVIHCVDRLIALAVDLSLGLLVAPLRFHFLNVRRVLEHEVTETGRRLGRQDLSPEAVMVELGEHARVVDVRMCQEDKVDLRRRDRQVHILKAVDPLLHAAVDQEFLLSDLYKMTASRYFVRRADKHQFHIKPPFGWLHPRLFSSPRPPCASGTEAADAPGRKYRKSTCSVFLSFHYNTG